MGRRSGLVVGLLISLCLVAVTGGCRAGGYARQITWRDYRPVRRTSDARLELALEHLRSLRAWERRAALTDVVRLLCGGDPAAYRPSMVVPTISDDNRTLAAERLMELLDDNDAQVRRQTCFALGVLGPPHARPAIPALARATADPDLKVARQAAFALGRLGINDQVAVQALTDQLVKPKSELRKTLIELNGKAKRQALRFYAAVSLFALLSKKTRLPITGKLAREGYGKTPTGESEPLGQLVPRLARGMLDDPDWRARRAAVLALGELGDKRSYVVRESLKRATADKDPRVAHAAAKARQKVLRGSNAGKEF